MQKKFLVIACVLCWIVGIGVEGSLAQRNPPAESPKNDAAAEPAASVPSPATAIPNAEPVSPGRPQETQSTQPLGGAGDASQPAAQKEVKPGHIDDWPWIIKQKKLTEPPSPKSTPPSFQWLSADQKTRCEQQAVEIREHFLKARYHSIQGDACTCAENAQKFLEVEKAIRSKCPKGFLEQNGYSTRIVRNLRWLQELGTQRCLGVVPEGGKPQAGKPGEAPAVRTP